MRINSYYFNESLDIFKNCLVKSLKNVTNWNTDSEFQNKKIKKLSEDLEKFIKFLDEDFSYENTFPFNKIYIWAEENVSDECIEYIVSMMMEPYDEIINPLVNRMSSDEDSDVENER